MKNPILDVPKPVVDVTMALERGGFEAYLVGGCVRDLLLGLRPKDWDITTNAKPDDIVILFSKTFYENKFGTVSLVDEVTSDPTLKIIEVTPYRKEGKYSDNRHPDEVQFCENINDDLARRDFTINAMAIDNKGHIIDLYKGLSDLDLREIACVGSPEERFEEDALRILRAVRISAELGFMINESTQKAIISKANLLKNISKERIRDEIIRLVSCKTPAKGFSDMRKLNIIPYIIPELQETFDIGQNKAHSYDVWNHLLKALQHTADKDWPLNVRLAALLHDIGKPRARRWSAEKKEWTFYGHDVVGAKMVKKILADLKFPKKDIEEITKLVRWHMFFSDTEQITLSAVRRMIVNVGKENIWDLMNLRVADRVGTGRPKENPYRLRKYRAMIDEALHDPISVGMLKINGRDVIAITNSNPGPKIGLILDILLKEVLEDPLKNTKDYLSNEAEALSKIPESELAELGEKAKQKKIVEEGKNIDQIRKRHWVK